MLSRWRLENTTARTLAQRRAKFLYWFGQLQPGDEVYVQSLRNDAHAEKIHRVERIQRAPGLDSCKVWVDGRCFGIEQFEKRPSIWAPHTIWTIWSKAASKTLKIRAHRNFGRLLYLAAQTSMDKAAMIEIAEVIGKHADDRMRLLCNTVLNGLQMPDLLALGTAVDVDAAPPVQQEVDAPQLTKIVRDAIAAVEAGHVSAELAFIMRCATPARA